MNNEVWKKIPIEGKRYIWECSNFGNIRSVRKNGIKNLKLSIQKTGYVHCNIANKYYRLHRIVMLTFVGESDLPVDHIDRNPLNNRLDNLRYVTDRENSCNTSYFRTDITEMDKKERKNIRVNLWKKKKITCECGEIICNAVKSRHKKSKKHQNYLNKIPEYECECGSQIRNVGKVRHETSQKHQNYLKSLNNDV